MYGNPDTCAFGYALSSLFRSFLQQEVIVIPRKEDDLTDVIVVEDGSKRIK